MRSARCWTRTPATSPVRSFGPMAAGASRIQAAPPSAGSAIRRRCAAHCSSMNGVATYVVDGVLAMRAAAFFPTIPGDYWSVRPELLTANGTMPMSAGGLLIERDGTSLLMLELSARMRVCVCSAEEAVTIARMSKHRVRRAGAVTGDGRPRACAAGHPRTPCWPYWS